MFLFRIGKEKWVYTLTMSLHKVKCSELSTLRVGSKLEIQVKRGNHEFKYLCNVNKKGQIVMDKTERTIPMTLYYDMDDKKFNKKEMIISGRVLDEFNSAEIDLGQAQLDIAEYAKQEGIQKFILEVELQGDQKQVCKIKFNVTIQRNLGEGAVTTETNTQAISEPEEKKSVKSREKTRTNRSKLKESSINLIPKREFQEKSESSLMPTPQKKIQNKLTNNFRKNKQQSQISLFQYLQTDKGPSPVQKEGSPSFEEEDNETVVLGRSNTPPQLKNNTSDVYSTELKLHQAQQMLKIKDKELAKVRKLLEDQQKINLTLIEDQRKEHKYKESAKLNRQVSQLKTQLDVANMKISELESANRSYLDQIERAHLSGDKMSQQIIYYKGLLEKQKMKMAELLQRALQTGNNTLISLIQEFVTEQ